MRNGVKAKQEAPTTRASIESGSEDFSLERTEYEYMSAVERLRTGVDCGMCLTATIRTEMHVAVVARYRFTYNSSTITT